MVPDVPGCVAELRLDLPAKTPKALHPGAAKLKRKTFPKP